MLLRQNDKKSIDLTLLNEFFSPRLDGLPLPTTPSTSCYVLDSRTTPASETNHSRAPKRNGSATWFQESSGRLHCKMRLKQFLRLSSKKIEVH